LLIAPARQDISRKKRIGAANQRKSFCDDDFCPIQGAAPAPTECNPDLFGFAPVWIRTCRLPRYYDGGSITSDAESLLLKQTDRAIRPTRRLAARFHDPRELGRAERRAITNGAREPRPGRDCLLKNAEE
jgi:hypothetical protein